MGMYGEEYFVAITAEGNIKADRQGRAYAAKTKSKVEDMLRMDGRIPSKYDIKGVMLTFLK